MELSLLLSESRGKTWRRKPSAYFLYFYSQSQGNKSYLLWACFLPGIGGSFSFYHFLLSLSISTSWGGMEDGRDMGKLRNSKKKRLKTEIGMRTFVSFFFLFLLYSYSLGLEFSLILLPHQFPKFEPCSDTLHTYFDSATWIGWFVFGRASWWTHYFFFENG